MENPRRICFCCFLVKSMCFEKKFQSCSIFAQEFTELKSVLCMMPQKSLFNIEVLSIADVRKQDFLNVSEMSSLTYRPSRTVRPFFLDTRVKIAVSSDKCKYISQLEINSKCHQRRLTSQSVSFNGSFLKGVNNWQYRSFSNFFAWKSKILYCKRKFIEQKGRRNK